MSLSVLGGDAGEEVRGPVCVPAGSQDDPDGFPAVSHEQELREASQLGLREPHDAPHHPVQHEDAGTCRTVCTADIDIAARSTNVHCCVLCLCPVLVR